MDKNPAAPAVRVVDGPLAEVRADLLVVGHLQESDLSGPIAALDRALGGAIARSLEAGAFKGRAGELEWIYPAPVKSSRVLLVGLGKASEHDVRSLRRVAAMSARNARTKRAATVCICLEAPEDVTAEKAIEAIADGALSGLVDSDLYRDRTQKGAVVEVLVWSEAAGAPAAVERGAKLAAEVSFARWLGDEPANIMTPERVADEIARRAATLGVGCEVIGEEEIRAAGMLALLSVAEGSARSPRVVVLTYRGSSGETVAVCGKGVTFDTGGISIKPAADMHYMKYDMCGAAAAVGTVFSLASVGAKTNVIGIVGLVENMPSGSATRPGDVVRAANGKTIEIINTDAEGRLVLADVLDLARKRGASRLVDLATLTGAIKVALGTAATGAMANSQEWMDEVLSAAKRAGERLWQMPLYPDYFELLKSNIADMTNSGGRYGGALSAGAFLQQFVGDTPWVHLDIAGTAYTEKDSPAQMKGATGVMIRTLVDLLGTRG